MSGEASQIDTFNRLTADRAVDGDTSGNRHTSLTHTATQGPTAWWKVVLPSRSYIDNIQIYNREDCCGARIDGVTVYVDDELVGTVTYEGGKRLYSFNDLSIIGQEVTVKGGSDFVSLGEVEVYGVLGKSWGSIV